MISKEISFFMSSVLLPAGGVGLLGHGVVGGVKKQKAEAIASAFFASAKNVINKRGNVIDLLGDFRYNDGASSHLARLCKLGRGKPRLRAEHPKKGNVIFVTAAQVDLL